MGKIKNAFNSVKSTRITKQGDAGYDNARENIDPHVKTKAISTKEITLSDGSGAGFVKNSASGVLSGGYSIDISADTNLAVNSPIILTGDTLSFDFTLDNIWTGAKNTFNDLQCDSIACSDTFGQIALSSPGIGITILQDGTPFMGCTITLPNNTCTLPGLSLSNTWAANQTFSTEIIGSLVSLAVGGQNSSAIGTGYTKTINGMVMSANKGFVMPCAGSITKIGVSCYIPAATAPAAAIFHVYKNGSSVFSVQVDATDGTGWKTLYNSQARDTDTFVAGDVISLYVAEELGVGGAMDIDWPLISVWGYFDE